MKQFDSKNKKKERIRGNSAGTPETSAAIKGVRSASQIINIWLGSGGTHPRAVVVGTRGGGGGGSSDRVVSSIYKAELGPDARRAASLGRRRREMAEIRITGETRGRAGSNTTATYSYNVVLAYHEGLQGLSLQRGVARGVTMINNRFTALVEGCLYVEEVIKFTSFGAKVTRYLKCALTFVAMWFYPDEFCKKTLFFFLGSSIDWLC